MSPGTPAFVEITKATSTAVDFKEDEEGYEAPQVHMSAKVLYNA